ncbi:MAG: ABC transporter ATP-binding protein [Thermodesulfobacteriota bacterium]
MINTSVPPIIVGRELCKSYPSGDDRVHPLRGVDITLYPGQFIAIMGPSGSGKSTLLHILGLLERPDAGSYYLQGNDVSCLDDRELSRLRASGIGFVFQAYNLIAQCTLVENVIMPFLYSPNPPADARDLALNALEEVGLSGRKTHRPNQLSGGEMQRAAIARALVINPLVVLADEPTGNLDTENARGILKLFRRMNEKGTALMVVTHDADVAREADLVLHIKDGRFHE